MKTHRPYLLSFLFLSSLGGYILIGYGIERSNFDLFIGSYAVLFLCFFLSLRWVDSKKKLQYAIAAAILFRVALLFSIPTLSDDFYRFIWDGNLLAHGINPFAHTPVFYMQNGLPSFLSAELFNNLNSQTYYTVYPSVCQYIFWISAQLAGTNPLGNVIVMKVILLAFELGTFWVMQRLLNYFKLPFKYLLIYALNPLIILELTGNLHFEGMMIFFLLAAFYLFLRQKVWTASLCFILAVNTKLIPLLLLPYLVFSLGWKRATQLVSLVLVGTVLLHIPFLGPEFLTHFSDSLALYFQSFEFNASLYYLVRWVGFQTVGYNIIQTAAPLMALAACAIIITVSWKYRDRSLKNLAFIYITIVTVYYLLSTTVHPWYITSLVAIVPLTGFYFPVAWSALIPLTYIAYSTSIYSESLWLVGVEYIFILGVVVYDFYYRKKPVKEKMRIIYS